jgi:hypothetical protein
VPGHIFENITHSNPLSPIFNQISDILHHTGATVPFPNHTGATVPFSNIAHLDGGTLPISSIVHTEATVPFSTLPISNVVHHTGETVPFSNVAHLDGGTNPISNIVHHVEATVPFSNIAHGGLSQSFWTEAAGSGELRALAGPTVHPIMDLANNAHIGVGLASHIPEINSPASQFAANHVDAVQHVEVAQLVHPVNPGPVYASFDVAPHVAEFAHQIHI